MVAGRASSILCGIRGAVVDERIQFDERSWIKQEVQPLACRQLAAIVLRVDSFLPATKLSLGAHVAQSIEALFLGGHVEIVTRLRCPQKR